MHCRPSATQNGRDAAEGFSTHRESYPCSQTLQPVLTTEPLFHIDCSKKNVIWLFIFCHLKLIFLQIGLLYSDFSSWISRPDTKYKNSWTQTMNLWLIHLITFYIDWGWNIFTSHNCCSMLIEQLIYLEKERTDNLKFRAHLQGQVMDSWSVTQ